MKKYLLTTFTFLICFHFASAQKASDVLENGKHIKSRQKLILQFENGILKYDATKSFQDSKNPLYLTSLEDSTIFLLSRSGLNIYLKPLNPLNFSYTSDVKEIIDPINESAATALETIIKIFERPTPDNNKPTNKNDNAIQSFFDKTYLNDSLRKITSETQNKLKENQKEDIIKYFNILKSMDFSDDESTKKTLDASQIAITNINNHFKTVGKLIDSAKKVIENYNCDSDESFNSKFIFTLIIKDLTTTLEEQKKRLDNLQTCYNLVDKAYQSASKGGGENGLRWCYILPGISSKQGKINVNTITIKESGYLLSDKGEIVSREAKDTIKQTIRFRRFQRFVPEVSIGTAFTFFKYNSYGTTSDSTDQQYVSTPTEKTMSNLNITTMLNFNYYIPNSPIHPFYQLGLGINSNIPTILTGFGLRSNINGIKRLTISGGLAMSWLQELDKLKVGDKISGTADIEKDLKTGIAPKFSRYIGIQYNF
jgi:hypothetical protein